MPPDQCAFCPKCNTTLSTHPDFHREPTPHEFDSVQTITTDQGQATITRCRYCHLTQAEIDKRGLDKP